MKQVTAFCEDCIHKEWNFFANPLCCSKGHSPGFYAPENPVDTQWGWKRRCSDFVLDTEKRATHHEATNAVIAEQTKGSQYGPW